MRRSVLWVDDDETTLLLGRRLLEQEGYGVHTAPTGSEARSLIEHDEPDIVLIDLRLPDESGVDLLRVVRAAHPRAVCIIVTGFATCRATVDAMRLGAFDVIEKPLCGDALVALVHRAAANLPPSGACAQHAFRRWAEVVIRGVASPSDPRTLTQWGRTAGASRGALRNWCHTAGISPRRALLFTRLLRAVIRHAETRAGFEQLLDVVDRRTLMKLAVLSGSSDGVFPETVEAFLAQQRLVTERAAVEELATMWRAAAARADGVSIRPSAAAGLRSGVSI